MAKEQKAHPIFEKAREMAAAIDVQPQDIPEGEPVRLAYRQHFEAYTAAVKQAYACYRDFADSCLAPFGFNFGKVHVMIVKKAILDEAEGWSKLFEWDFPGLNEAEEKVLLRGWADGALGGCLKESGR